MRYILFSVFVSSLSFPSLSTAQNTSLPLPPFPPTNLPTCSNATIPWPLDSSSIGHPLNPQQPPSDLKTLLTSISPTRIRATVEKLVSFGTRHTLSTQNSTTRGIGAARDWIEAELRGYAESSGGRMTVEVSGYVQGVGPRVPFPVRVGNVVAVLRGSGEEEGGEGGKGRTYVVSGHYDCRVSDVMDFEGDAPGADDDASGVAVMLELARLLSPTQPLATILFAAVAGEEQSLLGSAHLASTLKAANVNVEAMLNNDIVGSPRSDSGRSDPFVVRLFAQGTPLTEAPEVAGQRVTIGGENDSPARELARFVRDVAANEDTGMDVAVIYRLDRYLRGGDHSSFLQQGFPAIRFTEPNEDYAHQHQDVRVVDGVQYGDLPEFCDWDYISRVTRVNMATLWSLANGPGMPRGVYLNSSLLTNESQLFWDKDESGEVQGYEVVWRATDAPDWTHGVVVGGVGTVTLGLSRDNIVFGVRALGKGGLRGVAVLPFPSG
ncbi:aminopeptidase [Aulographum hederae CBS 113979]|uniref:Peptide hydrolase n=1 Tax=Aulographum hederae CBS 113979 TaxID=1176131 RepID=A0A6G1HH99_9PEZI|nr:aminopeptidase [Aulographum hederae CBS 113979]